MNAFRPHGRAGAHDKTPVPPSHLKPLPGSTPYTTGLLATIERWSGCSGRGLDAGQPTLMPNSEHCLPGYLCTGLYAVSTRGVMPTQGLSFVSESLPSLAQADDHRAKTVLRAVGHLKCELSQAVDRRTEAGRLPWAGGQAAAVGTRRAGRRGLPRGASSPMRQGVTDTRRSLRILADYPSETAQVTGTERLTWPSAARRSRRLRFARCPLGFRLRQRHQCRHRLQTRSLAGSFAHSVGFAGQCPVSSATTGASASAALAPTPK